MIEDSHKDRSWERVVLTVLASLWCVPGIFWGGVSMLGDPFDPLPGDPSFPELVLLFVGFSLTVPILVMVTRIWRRTTDRGVIRSRRFLDLVVGLTVLLALPSVIAIGRRHLGPWGELKAQLAHAESHVQRIAGDDDVLSEDELAAAKAMIGEQPTSMPGVTMQVMGTASPFMTVHFGGGLNAKFDPRTMVCTYSD